MKIMLTIMLIIFLPVIRGNIHLSNTEDGFSIEYYDCFNHRNISYCRRPSIPIDLHRDNLNGICFHNGKAHSFEELISNNIRIDQILISWRLPFEMIEDYLRYLSFDLDKNIENKKYLCECTNIRSFGKNCEYLLVNETLNMTIDWEYSMKITFYSKGSKKIDITCYTTLICDSGLLCLDWRHICDGIQQCMFGYDEENCDLLEFNECEENEYRCLNGMCIPDEYFLDSDYDCIDLSDEYQYDIDIFCYEHEIRFNCDDRVCPRNTWSCGDGQCILDNLAFQTWSSSEQIWTAKCQNNRNQYFMCETDSYFDLWTLPNGKCNSLVDEYVPDELNDSGNLLDNCEFLIKCVLTFRFNIYCQCEDHESCVELLQNKCNSTDFIQYPKNGAIILPYVFYLFDIKRDWSVSTPDYVLINGTIKCRGYMITHVMRIPFEQFISLFKKIEHFLCNSLPKNSTQMSKGGYNRSCYNNSKTFTNQFYNYIDICQYSRECISAYRIRDGSIDCADELDEKRTETSLIIRQQIKRFRLRCSVNEVTYLPITIIGDGIANCQNNFDEFSLKTYTRLLSLKCDSKVNSDCRFLRQFLETSWNDENNLNMIDLKYKKRIPFHSYCDGFWDLPLQADENVTLCQSHWICLENQWTCRTGQCIYSNWILDEEWDCSDASDEQAFFFSSNAVSAHNIKFLETIHYERFTEIYPTNLPLAKLCNTSKEFPCVRIDIPNNVSQLTRDHLCLPLEKLGDNVADCMGGLDERNTLTDCNGHAMLGERSFKCLTTNTCINHRDICDIRCPNSLDDDMVCFGKNKSDNCAELTVDFMCLDNHCEKSSWCDGYPDCLYGEDEYLCHPPGFELYDRISPKNQFYRISKFNDLPILFQRLSIQKHSDNQRIYHHSEPIKTRTLSLSKSNEQNFMISFICDRGIGIFTHNNSIVCFCPPQYYGERCQYYNDRITVILQLNMSHTIYEQVTDTSILLKLVVFFLFENQTIQTYEFHVRPALEKQLSSKNINYVLYSRSNQSLNHKRTRYFNRSNIIHEQPYTIQINAYELKFNATVKLIAIWRYSIHFDFLPNHQFVKILHLQKRFDVKNPCSSNPCNFHQQCFQLLNEKTKYICYCRANYHGPNCSQLNTMCSNHFCHSDALCDSNYRNSLKSSDQPYCICPNHRLGVRCHIDYNPCHSNPCEKNRLCLRNLTTMNTYFCVCDAYHRGDDCEIEKRPLYVSLHQNIQHQGAVIHYLCARTFSDIAAIINQYAYVSLPEHVKYMEYLDECKFKAILIKIYLNKEEFQIYLTNFLYNEKIFDNSSIVLNEQSRVLNVQTLSNSSTEVTPYEFHRLCRNNLKLSKFYSDIYLCLCVNNNSRAMCFLYDDYLERCFACESNGLCIRNDLEQSNKFICICPRCYYGHTCQFSTEGLSFTFDSLIVYNSFGVNLIYLILSLVIFLFGCLTNYASFVTFKRPNLYKTSVGNYLFILSFLSQITLVILLTKIIYTIFPLIPNNILCKIITFLLSVTIRQSHWLISSISISRLCLVLFPYKKTLGKSRQNLIINVLTSVIIIGMHIHQLIFYKSIRDSTGLPICVANFTIKFATYDRINVFIHYLIPFCIQIVSVTLLILLAARSHSRTKNKRTQFIQVFKEEFQIQRELYITPIIIILSSLPHIIFSFSLACTNLSTWQRHALLLTYLVSYTPQAFSFFIFVLPSTTYSNEFKQTKLAKSCLFEWIFKKK